MNPTEKFSFLKNKRFYIALLIGAGIILAIVLNLDKVGGFFSWLLNVFKPIIIGGCIAFVLNILMSFFSDKVFRFIHHNGLRTTLSLIVSIAIIFIIIIAVIGIVVPQLLDSFRLIAQKLPGALESLRASLEKLTQNFPALSDSLANLKTDTNSFNTELTNFFKSVLPNTINTTASVVVSSVKNVMTILIALLFALYILIFKSSLEKNSRELCYSLLPKKVANRTLYIFHLLSDYFRAFIYGRVVDAVCLAVMYLIPALLLRLPYTLMMTTLFAVFSIIPLFGPLISWGIGLFLISTVSIPQAILFTVIFVIILLITRNIIYPRVIGKSIGLPDFWVMFAVIVGGKMFGIVGMLTAVPVFALIYTLIREFVLKRVKENPEEVDEILNKSSWNTYNPETDLFEDHPVTIDDPLDETKKVNKK